MPEQKNQDPLEITVRGGYQPRVSYVPEGRPTQLTITRSERGSCGREIVFPWLDLRRTLPLDVPVTVDLPALAPGEYEYSCGMNMMRGTIVVEPADR